MTVVCSSGALACVWGNSCIQEYKLEQHYCRPTLCLMPRNIMHDAVRVQVLQWQALCSAAASGRLKAMYVEWCVSSPVTFTIPRGREATQNARETVLKACILLNRETICFGICYIRTPKSCDVYTDDVVMKTNQRKVAKVLLFAKRSLVWGHVRKLGRWLCTMMYIGRFVVFINLTLTICK